MAFSLTAEDICKTIVLHVRSVDRIQTDLSHKLCVAMPATYHAERALEVRYLDGTVFYRRGGEFHTMAFTQYLACLEHLGYVRRSNGTETT